MLCGASASTRIHEADRHTRRFGFDSSNSSSVVFVICSLKYVEQKERLRLFSFFCLCASLPCSTLFRGHVLSCFSSYSLFHLASDLARFCFQFRSCFTVHPLLSRRRTHIHTFPHTGTPPSHSKQINSALAAIGTPQ